MPTSLMPTFEAEIRAHIMSTMPWEPAAQPTLEAMPATELLATYRNWRMRFVVQRPRRVHLSQAIRDNPWRLEPRYQSAFEGLVKKIEDGEDLTPHLSRAIVRPYRDGAPGTSSFRSNLDLMLNDWSIHHLHISLNLEPDGFVQRTEMLVFAAFQGDDAFLIDILPHGSWTLSSIVDVLIDEWPDSVFVREIPGIVGLSGTPTDEERAELRKAGIMSSWFERDGRVYMIGFGMTSASTSLFAIRNANALIVGLRNWDKHVMEHPDYVPDILRHNGYAVPENLEFEFIFMKYERYGIREKNTGAIFPPPGFENT